MPRTDSKTPCSREVDDKQLQYLQRDYPGEIGILRQSMCFSNYLTTIHTNSTLGIDINTPQKTWPPKILKIPKKLQKLK